MNVKERTFLKPVKCDNIAKEVSEGIQSAMSRHTCRYGAGTPRHQSKDPRTDRDKKPEGDRSLIQIVDMPDRKQPRLEYADPTVFP